MTIRREFRSAVHMAQVALVLSASVLAVAGAQAQSSALALARTGASKAQSVAVAKANARTPAELSPNALGDFSRDNVYTAVTPCRIVDTRVAGGQFNPATTRQFDVDGANSSTVNYAPQGGYAGSCGIPYGVAASVAMTITVTNTAAPGYITAWGLGTQPFSSVINYAAGQTTANTTIVPVVPGVGADFSIYSSAKTNVIIDVVGYFAAPSVTPLSLSTLAGTWTATFSGFTGCANSAMQIPFTLDGAGNGTGTLRVHDGCGDSTLPNQSFVITSLNADGSGTAGLSAGSGGYNLLIQLSPDRQVMNLVDVDPANPGNYISGVAVRH